MLCRDMEPSEMVGKRFLVPRRDEPMLFPDLFDALEVLAEGRLRGTLLSGGQVEVIKPDHRVKMNRLGDCLTGPSWMGPTEDLKKALVEGGCLRVEGSEPPQYKVFFAGCFGLGGDEVIAKASDICHTLDGWRSVCALLPTGSGVRVTVIG